MAKIEQFRHLAKLSDLIFDEVSKFLRSSLTELTVADFIDETIKKLGITQKSFISLVASGKRSAFFHAQPTKKRIKKGEFIFIDLGIKEKGLCSDCTRTFFIGRPTIRQINIYQKVLTAQKLAINQVNHKVKVKNLDISVRKYFKSFGIENYFPHSLGHGINNKVHANPKIYYTKNIALKAFQVITIEPGLYFKGYGGVRIEDMVLVKPTGFEVLTKFTKDLICKN